MIRLKGRYLSLLKTLHLLFMTSFFGGLTASLVILVSKPPAGLDLSLAGADIMLYRINTYIVYFSFFGLTITAILYGYLSNWGISRHRWIIIKWILLFVIAGVYIVAFKPSINGIAALSSGGQASGEETALYEALVRKSVLNNVVLVCLLVIIFFISTLKPFGRRNSDFLAENRIARISLIAVIILSTGFFILGWMNVNRLRTLPIGNPDLSMKPDGVYHGEFSDGSGVYHVNVEIEHHRISNVTLETDRNSEYVHYARPVIARVLKAQSLKVDAITGATTTSKCILKAVEEALKNDEIGSPSLK